MAEFRRAINSGNGDDYIDGTGDYAHASHPIVNYENVFPDNDGDLGWVSSLVERKELFRLQEKGKVDPLKRAWKSKFITCQMHQSYHQNS